MSKFIETPKQSIRCGKTSSLGQLKPNSSIPHRHISISEMGKILVAIAQASLYWILLNAALSQVLVVYRWNEYNPTLVQDIVKEVIIEKPLDPVIEEEIVVKEVASESVGEILDAHTKSRSKQLLLALYDAKHQQMTQLQESESKVALLVHQSIQPSTYPKQELASVATDVNSLQALLVQPTLAETKDDALINLLDKSLEELDNVVNSNASSSLLKTLVSLNLTRVDAPTVTKDCPTAPTGVRASGLKAAVGTVQHALRDQRRGRSLERLLSEINVEDFMALPLPESALADAPDQQQSKLTSKPAPDSDENRICLLEEDLMDMVDLALQKSPTDLQLALTKFVKDLDPDTDVILDALLPPPSSSIRATPRASTPTNLRQALNSEVLFYGSTKLIDTLVDWVSGYNDELDGVLDSLIQTAGEQSVGRIVVSKLLEAAGRVPLPTPVVNLYNTTQAGILLTKM